MCGTASVPPQGAASSDTRRRPPAHPLPCCLAASLPRSPPGVRSQETWESELATADQNKAILYLLKFLEERYTCIVTNPINAKSKHAFYERLHFEELIPGKRALAVLTRHRARASLKSYRVMLDAMDQKNTAQLR